MNHGLLAFLIFAVIVVALAYVFKRSTGRWPWQEDPTPPSTTTGGGASTGRRPPAPK